LLTKLKRYLCWPFKKKEISQDHREAFIDAVAAILLRKNEYSIKMAQVFVAAYAEYTRDQELVDAGSALIGLAMYVEENKEN
jgi:hypothetical protein